MILICKISHRKKRMESIRCPCGRRRRNHVSSSTAVLGGGQRKCDSRLPRSVGGPDGADGLLVGAAITLSELLAALEGSSELPNAAAAPLAAAAQLLRRVAGHHVRNAATLGGNLVLAAAGVLPSDPATALLALDARVRLASADAPEKPREVPLAEYLQTGGNQVPSPPPTPHVCKSLTLGHKTPLLCFVRPVPSRCITPATPVSV